MLRQIREKGLLRLVLAAPESKNKLSIRLLCELREALLQVEGSQFRAILLESSSPDIFAAGADMNELLKLNLNRAEEYAALGQEVTAALSRQAPEVTALVSGPCFGGGFDLALACRRVWATESALFCHPGAALGIMTGFGGTIRLPRRLPERCARQMLITGERLDALSAHRMGLVARLFPDHKSMMQCAIESFESVAQP